MISGLLELRSPVASIDPEIIAPGSVPVAEVDARAADLAALRTTSPLPAEPDRAWVDDWLHRSHLAHWAASG